MNDRDIELAAQIVVDTVLAEEIDMLSVREILDDQREEWVFFNRDDEPYHVPEESDEEAARILDKANEIMGWLRDRVEAFDR